VAVPKLPATPPAAPAAPAEPEHRPVLKVVKKKPLIVKKEGEQK
jgi:hypothetical protein